MNSLLTIYPVDWEAILISLGICVVLPCLVVFFVTWARRNEINRKTEVALKAIECGVQTDASYFTKKEEKKASVKARVFGYLIVSMVLSGLGLAFTILSFCPNLPSQLLIPGVILLLPGIAFLAVYFIARKQFAAEIKAEEEKLGKTE